MGKRQLHIGMLGTRGIPNNYGGFEQCAEFLSQALVERGHKVVVYCSDHDGSGEKNWNGVDLVYCRDPEQQMGAAGQFVYDLMCIRHARKMNYDVIIQFGYTSSSLWWRFWPRAKHIVNMDGMEFKRSKYSTAVKRFLEFAEKWATRRADVLVADNPEIESYLSAKYPASAVKYISYGATVPSEHVGSSRIESELNLLSTNYDLVISRMEPENNVELIIQAHCAATNDRSLVILGGTNNQYGQRLVKDYGDSVMFLGGIYDMDLVDELRFNCHWYLHGHSVGGTNPSLLEAMATAPRILAHDNPFNRSVLREGGSYFSTVEALVQLIDAPNEEVESNLERNRKTLVQDFNWEQITTAYEDACYDLVDD